MDSFFYIISCLFISFSEVYVWYKFYGEKINYKKISFYVSVFLMTFFGIFNYFYINAYVRVILVTCLLGFCNWFIFRKKINEIILSTIYGQFTLVIADVIGTCVLMFFFKIDAVSVRENYFGTLIGNYIVSIIFIVLCNFKFIKVIYKKLVIITNNFKLNNLLTFLFIVIVSINILVALIFYKLSSFLIVLINLFLILLYSFIVYKSMNEKNNSMIVKAENDSLMSSLHQYEDMVDRQRVDNHENKNQLLIIRNMIKKKDKDVVKYIDTIVKNHMEDDEALYTRVMTIPSGGLQGIIYQKMLVMKDEHIKISLDVGRGVRDFELDKLDMDDNYRLCKIVGVFLDNAIEESKKNDDKSIMISLYVDDDLVIEVSNRFEGKLDIDKLDESGYTTKGDGHGYGLSLVKKILSETDRFENIRSINRNVFKQVIKIKNT
ncbi:MAG: sensor histidine kinase [Bacilli bacterium]